MANVDEEKTEEGLAVADSAESKASASKLATTEATDVEVVGVRESLGADKYVFAAFFAAGIGAAFVATKLLTAVWGLLAAWPVTVRQFPQLLRIAEDDRSTYMTGVGAVLGFVTMVVLLRSERVRRWADDVALELSKVTWPKKETVTNGTIVVIAAGLFATVYIGLLDRLWGFVTMLVYGA